MTYKEYTELHPVWRTGITKENFTEEQQRKIEQFYEQCPGVISFLYVDVEKITMKELSRLGRRNGVKIRPYFKWFDFWIGWFYNTEDKILYIQLIPMLGIKIEFWPYEFNTQ